MNMLGAGRSCLRGPGMPAGETPSFNDLDTLRASKANIAKSEKIEGAGSKKNVCHNLQGVSPAGCFQTCGICLLTQVARTYR